MILPATVHNRLSYIGAGVAALAALAMVFLFITNTFVGHGGTPYAGLVIFVALPAVLLFGLALVPLGMVLEWNQVRRTGRRSIQFFPVLDLNQRTHLNATLIFAVGSIALLFASMFGSYQAYEATESVAFCGTLCHTPMHPEFVTYQRSPHARVPCVDCHVGPGADWYVKSKLSGAYQVYAVLSNSFPRPIPAPIESLRPAQATCEQCHWPQKFFGGQEKRFVHFLSDEKNTPWEIRMLIKTGGSKPPIGYGEGIHWHMNISNRIEYIATDPQRQQIPWVRMTDLRSGKSTEYVSTDKPLSAEQIAAAEPRVMDCMDCHNRPSHIFRSPGYLLDQALRLGEIDASLPFIKQTGVKLLAADYPSVDAAVAAIGSGLTQYYAENYPTLRDDQKAAVPRAVATLQEIYRQNFFPTMKARWDLYPNNAGHWSFPGCMRCHDDSHQSADGKVVTNVCTSCHVITGQGPSGALTFSTQPDGLPFEHPGDVGSTWEGMQCTDCHAGS